MRRARPPLLAALLVACSAALGPEPLAPGDPHAGTDIGVMARIHFNIQHQHLQQLEVEQLTTLTFSW